MRNPFRRRWGVLDTMDDTILETYRSKDEAKIRADLLTACMYAYRLGGRVVVVEL